MELCEVYNRVTAIIETSILALERINETEASYVVDVLKTAREPLAQFEKYVLLEVAK